MATLPDAAPDLLGTVLRALVLYALTEAQVGTARRVWLTVSEGSEEPEGAFSLRDDGRGHPLDKQLGGTPYLRFIYTHFDYPFGQPPGGTPAPVQLQGIGMSLVNALCAELQLTVRKPAETLVARWRQGVAAAAPLRVAEANGETGISLQGRLQPGLARGPVDTVALRAWLQQLAAAHPALALHFQGERLVPGAGVAGGG